VIVDQNKIPLRQLRLLIATEQFVHRLGGRLAFVDNRVNLIDNRSFYVQFTGALVGAASCRNSFCDHLHPIHDRFDRFTLAELFAHAPISAVPTKTCRNQVAGPAQSLKGSGFSAHRDPDAKQFGEGPIHKCRFGVITKSKSVANTGGNRENVFQRAAQLHARNFMTRVNADSFAHKMLLQGRSYVGLMTPEDGCRGQTARYLHGQIRT
jgi:hypothetical protein